MKARNQIKYQDYFIYITVSFIVLYFIYSPLLHIPFYHHDIYKFTVGGTDKFCKQDYGYDNMFIFVRPLVALLDCANFKLGSTFQNMSYLRLKCIVLACLFATFIGFWMYRRGFSFWISIIIGTLFFCLPGIQTAMIMGTDALIIAPFLAFAGALLIERSFNGHCSIRMLTLKQIILIGSGLICLFSSFLTYLAEGAFFLVPAMVLTLFQPLSSWKTTRQFVFRDIFIFTCSSIIFLFIARFVQHKLITINYPSNYTFHVNFMLSERIVGLAKVFPSLWNINYQSLPQAVFVYLIISIATIVAARSYWSGRVVPLFTIIQAGLCVFAILFLSSLTYLAQPSNMIFTRVLFVFQVMSIVIFIWAAKKIITRFFRTQAYKFFLGLLGGLLFMGATYSNYVVTQSALNDNMEFNYLVASLNNALIHHKHIKHIHIVGLPYGSEDNFNGRKSRDDIYNINSTIYRQDSFYMVDSALKQVANPRTYSLFNCALDEIQLKDNTEAKCIQSAPPDSIIVTYSRQHEHINKTPGMLIINMTADEVHFPSHPKLIFKAGVFLYPHEI